MAFDEDGQHAESAAKLYVRPGISDHDAGLRGNLREVGLRLLEEAWERLAAATFVLVVGTKIEGIDVRSLRFQVALECGVDGGHVGGAVESQGDAALIGDDDDSQSGAVELADRFLHAGQWLKFARRSYVAAFGHFLIQDAVAIKENGVQRAG